MKTERRQELKTNDLSAFLAEANLWIRDHVYALAAGIGAVLVVIIALNIVQSSRRNSLAEAFDTLAQLDFTAEKAAESFDTLDRLLTASDHRDLRMSGLVRKAAAALALAVGQKDGFHPEYLDRAEQACKDLVRSFPERIPVVGMATGNLASIEESRFVVDGAASHRDQARQYLETLQNDPRFKGTPFQTEAAERLKRLDQTFQVVVLADPLPEPPGPPAEGAPVVPDSLPIKVEGGNVQIRKLEGPPPGFEQLDNEPGESAEEPQAENPPPQR